MESSDIDEINFELKFIRAIESWPEWNLNPQPRTYCIHALTDKIPEPNELSGQEPHQMRCAWYIHLLQDQMNTNLTSYFQVD